MQTGSTGWRTWQTSEWMSGEHACACPGACAAAWAVCRSAARQRPCPCACRCAASLHARPGRQRPAAHAVLRPLPIARSARDVISELDTLAGGCVLCHEVDFQRGGFGPRTIMLCDQVGGGAGAAAAAGGGWSARLVSAAREVFCWVLPVAKPAAPRRQAAHAAHAALPCSLGPAVRARVPRGVPQKVRQVRPGRRARR